MAVDTQDQREFYVVPDEDKIDPDKRGQVWATAETLQNTLGDLFPVTCSYPVCKRGECTGYTVVDRLVDSEVTRIGEAPTGAAREQLAQQASRAIEADAPLALVGIYGTPRHLDHPELNKAQLADLAAIMMMQGALDRVYSAFETGARFRAVDENLSALWLDLAQHPKGEEGKTEFQKTYAQYFADRKRLLEVLAQEGLINTGNTRIDLLSESDLYSKIWQRSGSEHSRPEYDFLAKAEKVRPIILQYLISSGEEFKRIYGDDDRAWPSSEENPRLWEEFQKKIVDSEEYAKLKESGWQGLIPPEMRKYYLEKFRQILGNEALAADDQLLLFHVATYLASTLEKYKAGTLTEGLPAGTPIIKVPLVKPVDGRPSSHQVLVAQRTLPKPTGSVKKRVSNTNRPAWGSVAVHSGGKLRLMDVADYLETPPELVVPAQVYMVGPDKGAGSYLTDTAIILENQPKPAVS